MNNLSVFEYREVLVVDSRLIAVRLGIKHKNFIATIDKHKSTIEQAFGTVLFQTEPRKDGNTGGDQPRYCLLTEDQSTFVMTLSRNSPEVIQCKVDLVKAFSKAKHELNTRSRTPQPSQASMVGYWAERQRLFIQRTTIPSGWFCVFQEMAQLMWQLENLGYVIPEYSPVDNTRIVPDISIGGMFCKHMRKKRFPVDSTVQKYPHYYPGWKLPVKANIYPNSWLEEFRAWFDEQWKPNRLVKYLGKKDPNSLPSICKLMGLPEAPVKLKMLKHKDEAILVPED